MRIKVRAATSGIVRKCRVYQGIISAINCPGVATDWESIYHYCVGFLNRLHPKVSPEDVCFEVQDLVDRGIVRYDLMSGEFFEVKERFVSEIKVAQHEPGRILSEIKIARQESTIIIGAEVRGVRPVSKVFFT